MISFPNNAEQQRATKWIVTCQNAMNENPYKDFFCGYGNYENFELCFKNESQILANLKVNVVAQQNNLSKLDAYIGQQSPKTVGPNVYQLLQSTRKEFAQDLKALQGLTNRLENKNSAYKPYAIAAASCIAVALVALAAYSGIKS